MQIYYSLYYFLTEQLNEIRKVTLARLLCDNGDNMGHMQALAMESVSPETNARKSCADAAIARFDVNQWEDFTDDNLLP